jgi:hypothetical protein
MGTKVIDNFSILHAASGVFLYFWGFTLAQTTIIHLLFELLENTKPVMKLTNETGWWPGGKPNPDNLTNIISDTVFSIIGWTVSYMIDKRYRKDVQERGKLI